MSRLFTSVVASVVIAPCALAQNALGDGRALENNLQVGGVPYSNRNTLGNALRFQNAIVTGNAPGGLSFRGDLDYRAPGEFTGEYADIDNYNFRRDSFFSGLAGQGVRGTEALQLQFDLMTGANNSTNLGGSLITSRPFEGAYAQNYATERSNALYQGRPYTLSLPSADAKPVVPLDIEDPAFDRRGDPMLNLRSSATVTANNPLRTQHIQRNFDQAGNPIDITVSTLGGVNFVPVPPSKIDNKIPELAPNRPSSLPRIEPQDPQRPAGAVDEGRTYEDLLDDLDEIKLPRVENLPEGVELPEDIDLPESESKAWQQRLLGLRRSLLFQPEFMKSDEDDESSPLIRRPPDPVTVNMLKQAGGTIDALSPIGTGGVDAYTINMSYAEKFLEEGRFFDAEERFARALSARPGDPMAAVGRVHAELGAGMYLSAVLNLRALFAQNPELMATRYAPEILPKPDRIDAVKADLRKRLGEDSGLPREAGVLLAYLGHQTRDQQSILTGLAIADKAAVDLNDDRFGAMLDLLRGVWVPEIAPVDD